MKHHRILAAAAFLAVAISAANAAQHPTPEQMQQRFEQMQMMMNQAQQAKSPAERQTLMGEHMKMMQEQMVAMRSMMGPDGIMGQNQGGSTMDPEAALQMQTMHQHISMMQQMMEQMMQEHQIMMMPAP